MYTVLQEQHPVVHFCKRMKIAKKLTRLITVLVAVLLTVTMLTSNIAVWLTLQHVDMRHHLKIIIAGVCMILTLSSSVLLVVFLRRIVRRRCLEQYEDLLHAGHWITQKALYDPSAPESTPAEVAPPLHNTSSPMVEALDSWYGELSESARAGRALQENELWTDLTVAKEFQRSFLERPYPTVPHVHVKGRLRLRFSHTYEATFELGGDFFDIFHIGPDCAGVFVADVMGHGTRAALITATLRTLINDLSRHGRNPRFFMSEMNKLYCGLMRNIPESVFASAFYFAADTTSRVATFSSAGHPPPFHIRRNTGRITRLKVPKPMGAALGLFHGEKYTAGQCRLVDRDVFIFFTDGAYEAFNEHGEEFGIERMQKTLEELKYNPTGEIVKGLTNAINQFVGSEALADDICIVSVEVTTEGETADTKQPTGSQR